jgi:hypothetical protein
MNIKSILSVILLFTLNSMNGQDKIITVQNDTIECKILSISSTHINYEITGDNLVTGKFIPISQVLEYYRDTERKATALPVPDRTRRSDSPRFKRWHAGVQFGGSYLLASTTDVENELIAQNLSRDDVKDHYRQLKRGIHVGGSAYYMFSKYVGAGLKYLLFHSSGTAEFMYPLGAIDYFFIDMNEKIYVNYVGHSVTSQQWFGRGKKFRLAEEVSLGYANYRDEAKIGGTNTLLTGHTVGGTAGVSFEYYLLNWLSAGAHVSVFTATFTKLKVSDGRQTATVNLNADEYENMSHLDYGISVRFHF